jgi:hypothetical protein
MLSYMRDTFLELDTMLNDEPVCGGINEFVSFHIIGVSNKDTLCTLCIKCIPLLRGNPVPCMRTEYTEVGHFWFEATPSLEGGLILDGSMGIFFSDVGCSIKCLIP